MVSIKIAKYNGAGCIKSISPSLLHMRMHTHTHTHALILSLFLSLSLKHTHTVFKTHSMLHLGKEQNNKQKRKGYNLRKMPAVTGYRASRWHRMLFSTYTKCASHWRHWSQHKFTRIDIITDICATRLLRSGLSNEHTKVTATQTSTFVQHQ